MKDSSRNTPYYWTTAKLVSKAWESLRSNNHLSNVIRRRRALAIFINIASSWCSIVCRAQQAIGHGDYVDYVEFPEYLTDTENPTHDQLVELDAIMMEHMETMRHIFINASTRLEDDRGL